MKIAWINQTKYRKVCARFAQSAPNCQTYKYRAHKDYSHCDVVVSFGDTPVKIAEHQTWYHLDGAYLNRPNYIRITKNAFQPHKYMMDIDYPGDRWEQLGVSMQPWRNQGEYILICKVSDRNEKFLEFNMQKDLDFAIKQAKEAGIPYKVREKTDKFVKPFSVELDDAYALVTWASTTSVEAVLKGIPIFLLHNSASDPMAGNIENMQQPFRPDRTQWAYNLAYQQWNRQEIKDGTAWKHFMEIEA